MSANYMLEIYLPGSADDVWVSFESDAPFMAIAKGDILNPVAFPESPSPMKMCRVTSIEHILWANPDRPCHKILVFTEELENTRELRFGV